jgi:hypothetical protein
MAQQNKEKPTYLLIHTHRFGTDIHPFKSNEYYCGFYNGENISDDDTNIEKLIKKLKLDVEFDRSEESIEIIGLDLNSAIDID